MFFFLAETWSEYEISRITKQSNRIQLINVSATAVVDRDSIIGIATHYELKRPGIEYRWRRIFRTRPDRPKSQPSLLKNGYRVSLFGVKGPRRGAKHTRPSSAEVKERVELDLYPPLGLQACSRPNFNLYGTAVAYWWGKKPSKFGDSLVTTVSSLLSLFLNHCPLRRHHQQYTTTKRNEIHIFQTRSKELSSPLPTWERLRFWT